MKQLILHCHTYSKFLIGTRELAEQLAKELNDEQTAALIDICQLKGEDQKRAETEVFVPLLLKDQESRTLGWVVVSQVRPMGEEH